MLYILEEPMQGVFDYKIKSSFPKSLDDKNMDWAIPLRVQVVANKDIDFCSKFFFQTLSQLTVEPEESGLYEKMNKKIFPIKITYQGNQYNLQLRKQSSVKKIKAFIDKWEYYIWNFTVKEGSNEYAGNSDRTTKNTTIYGGSVSNESIVNAKKDYQFAINVNKEEESEELDLIFPKSLQFVGEFSWFDKKTLKELETIGDYSIAPKVRRLTGSGSSEFETELVYSLNDTESKKATSSETDDETSSDPIEEIFTAVEQQAGS
jgi:hypothetical protein